MDCSRNHSRGSQDSKRSNNSRYRNSSGMPLDSENEFDMKSSMAYSRHPSPPSYKPSFTANEPQNQSTTNHSTTFGHFTPQESKAHQYYQQNHQSYTNYSYFGQQLPEETETHMEYEYSESAVPFHHGSVEMPRYADSHTNESSQYENHHEQQRFGAQNHQQQQNRNRRTRDNKYFCNCEKTGCLKLYCACYRQGTACSARCRCKSCYNTVANQETLSRQRQVQEPVDKRLLQRQEEPGEEATEPSCSCRQSFCEKSYCACARSGRGCGHRCKCFHCKNPHGRRPTQSHGCGHGHGSGQGGFGATPVPVTA